MVLYLIFILFVSTAMTRRPSEQELAALLQEDPRLVEVEASPTCDAECHEDVREALLYRWELRQLRGEPLEPIDAEEADKPVKVQEHAVEAGKPVEAEKTLEGRPEPRIKALPADAIPEDETFAVEGSALPAAWTDWAGVVSACLVAVWAVVRAVTACCTACGVLRFLHPAPPTSLPEDCTGDEEGQPAVEVDGGEELSPRRSARLQSLDPPDFRPRLSSTRRPPVGLMTTTFQAGDQTFIYCPPIQGFVDTQDVTSSLSAPVAVAVHLLRWLPGMTSLVQRGPMNIAGVARVRLALGLQIEVPTTGGILASV